jgi:Asp-tRNA(Asn)/Glu-tRNA(Gln) amidotransferase A subunit family amidase
MNGLSGLKPTLGRVSPMALSALDCALHGVVRLERPSDLDCAGPHDRLYVPVGFQIVGRAFDESAVLAAGHAFQRTTKWHLDRPLPRVRSSGCMDAESMLR